jgi:hypothetical protein
MKTRYVHYGGRYFGIPYDGKGCRYYIEYYVKSGKGFLGKGSMSTTQWLFMLVTNLVPSDLQHVYDHVYFEEREV